MAPRPLEQLRSERASSLVEFALILPVFLLLLLGTIDLGLGFRTYLGLAGAANEGARWLAIHPTDLNGARTQVVAEAARVGVPAGALTIRFTPALSSYHAGDTVTVTVEYTYLLMFGALTRLPQIPFQVEATTQVLYE
jgi:Flp pilus assembly protein TadG